MAGSIRAFDDKVCGGERRIDVALHDIDRLENAVRLLGIEYGSLFVVLYHDPSSVQDLEILVGQQKNRLGHVANVALDEEWLILLDEVDDVSSGHVAVVDDIEAGDIEVELDR